MHINTCKLLYRAFERVRMNASTMTAVSMETAHTCPAVEEDDASG